MGAITLAIGPSSVHLKLIVNVSVAGAGPFN